MNRPSESNGSLIAVTFSSELGWMAALWRGANLTRLAFGNRSSATARRAACIPEGTSDTLTAAMEQLVERLRQFACGDRDDFLDVRLDLAGRTRFQQAVLQRCRRIPPGEVISYGQLSTLAGFPRSARAVGTVMAKNQIPLIIPCHRVVGARGALGGYSAPNGLRMKRRLLQLEGAVI